MFSTSSRSGGSKTLPRNASGSRPNPKEGLPWIVMFLIGGCATGGDGSGSPENLLTWPHGEYHLEGSIEYRQDTEGRAQTVRVDFQSDLAIGNDSSMRIENPSGVCRDRLPQEVMRDESQRQRTIPCGDVRYVLKPRGETIIAEIHVSTVESVRRRGQCRRWVTQGGQTVCAAYAYTVVTRRASKNSPMRVVRIGTDSRPENDVAATGFAPFET